MIKVVKIIYADKLSQQEPIEIEDASCQNISPGTPPVELCSLEPNQDCVVTEYSNWTSCCGGTQRRTRSIVIEQKNNGAKCPQVLCSRHDLKIKLLLFFIFNTIIILYETR